MMINKQETEKIKSPMETKGLDIGKIINWILTIALIISITYLAYTKWKMGYFDTCQMTCEELYNTFIRNCQ